jgi:hypothetical protein
MTHANATLTPKGRLELARLVVDKQWPLARAGERFSVKAGTAKRWADRYRHALERQIDPLTAMRIAPRGHAGARDSCPVAPSGGSWACGSHADGDRPGSPTTWA